MWGIFYTVCYVLARAKTHLNLCQSVIYSRIRLPCCQDMKVVQFEPEDGNSAINHLKPASLFCGEHSPKTAYLRADLLFSAKRFAVKRVKETKSQKSPLLLKYLGG